MTHVLQFLLSLLRRPQIEDSHEFGNASDLAPAKPDWLDRFRQNEGE